MWFVRLLISDSSISSIDFINPYIDYKSSDVGINDDYLYYSFQKFTIYLYYWIFLILLYILYASSSYFDVTSIFFIPIPFLDEAHAIPNDNAHDTSSPLR